MGGGSKERWSGRGERGRIGEGMGEWEGGGRKNGYGSREVYISAKGTILGFARDLILEGFQAQGEVPRLFPGQPRRACLNWPWPITILMNILHITIEPSFGDGWR